MFYNNLALIDTLLYTVSLSTENQAGVGTLTFPKSGNTLQNKFNI